MVLKDVQAVFETKRAVLQYFSSVLIPETDHIVIIPDLYSEFSLSHPGKRIAKKQFTLLLREFLERNSIQFEQSVLKRISVGLILTNVKHAKEEKDLTTIVVGNEFQTNPADNGC